MTYPKSRFAIAATLCLAIAAPSVCAQDEDTDWPAFWGTGAVGVANGFETAVRWDATNPDGKSILWKSSIPGFEVLFRNPLGEPCLATPAISAGVLFFRSAHSLIAVGSSDEAVDAPVIAKDGRKPNILFIAVDDLRPSLGCYGDNLAVSPNIDALAERGVTFNRAYCQVAVCNPSRASLMTGLRPDTLGVWTLPIHFREARPDAVTLPQWLRKSGYTAVSHGKIYHNPTPDPQSWSEPIRDLPALPFPYPDGTRQLVSQAMKKLPPNDWRKNNLRGPSTAAPDHVFVSVTSLFCPSLGLCVLLSTTLISTAQTEELKGDWSLILDSGLPAWMSIQESDDKPVVYPRLYVGSAGPHKDVEESNGRLKFTLNKNKKAKKTTTVDVGMKEGKLDGVIIRQSPDGSTEREAFTGKKIPLMPTSAPDISKVRFGQPIALFNGKDLTGWTTHKPKHDPEKKSGWSVVNGLLKNRTPKTDFSATGAYANLKTEAVFEDFWLHIEFLVEKQRNSGVYLRGMYEAQVVDRDSRMQGLQGVGAIFEMIKPSKNAGRPGGKWQSYDITLVDRHVTVVLNGEKVIDNQPIIGPTAGAVHTNPAEPGPIYLQGDHTEVSYRDIYLSPVLKD